MEKLSHDDNLRATAWAGTAARARIKKTACYLQWLIPATPKKEGRKLPLSLSYSKFAIQPPPLQQMHNNLATSAHTSPLQAALRSLEALLPGLSIHPSICLVALYLSPLLDNLFLSLIPPLHPSVQFSENSSTTELPLSPNLTALASTSSRIAWRPGSWPSDPGPSA